jgi:hypothetical protein
MMLSNYGGGLCMSGWVNGLKVISWVLFVAMLIGSLIAAFSVGGFIGIVLFVVGAIGSFWAVAIPMSIVSIAEDTGAILSKVHYMAIPQTLSLNQSKTKTCESCQSKFDTNSCGKCGWRPN